MPRSGNKMEATLSEGQCVVIIKDFMLVKIITSNLLTDLILHLKFVKSCDMKCEKRMAPGCGYCSSMDTCGNWKSKISYYHDM